MMKAVNIHLEINTTTITQIISTSSYSFCCFWQSIQYNFIYFTFHTWFHTQLFDISKKKEEETRIKKDKKIFCRQMWCRVIFMSIDWMGWNMKKGRRTTHTIVWQTEKRGRGNSYKLRNLRQKVLLKWLTM